METANFHLKFNIVKPQEEDLTPKPIVHLKKSRKHKSEQPKTNWNNLSKDYFETKIMWFLQQYKGPKPDDRFDWFPVGSQSQLNDQLTALKIELKLNDQNLFEFDYSPKEMDYLLLNITYKNKESSLKRPYLNQYISFLYNNEKWTTNKGFDHMNSVFEELHSGIVTIIFE